MFYTAPLWDWGEPGVLEQHTEPDGDGVIAEGTGGSPLGANTSLAREASTMKHQCYDAGHVQGFCSSFAAKCSTNSIPVHQSFLVGDAVPLHLPSWVWLPQAGLMPCLEYLFDIVGHSRKSSASSRSSAGRAALGYPLWDPLVGAGTCSEDGVLHSETSGSHDIALKSAVLMQGLLPVPGRMISTLHVLLIYIICILIYGILTEKEWGLGRDGGCLFVMLCLMWLSFRAGVLHVCVT